MHCKHTYCTEGNWCLTWCGNFSFFFKWNSYLWSIGQSLCQKKVRIIFCDSWISFIFIHFICKIDWTLVTIFTTIIERILCYLQCQSFHAKVLSPLGANESPDFESFWIICKSSIFVFSLKHNRYCWQRQTLTPFAELELVNQVPAAASSP